MLAKIDVLARVAARLIRAAGNRRPIARTLKLRVAPLDLAVNSRPDQHQRATVLTGSGRFGATRVEPLPNSADRAQQERVAPCAPVNTPLPAPSSGSCGDHHQLRFEVAVQLDDPPDRPRGPVEEDLALAAAIAVARPNDLPAGTACDRRGEHPPPRINLPVKDVLVDGQALATRGRDDRRLDPVAQHQRLRLLGRRGRLVLVW